MGSLSVALFRRGQWSRNQTRGSLPSNMAPITDPVALLRHDTHPRVHSSSSSSSSSVPSFFSSDIELYTKRGRQKKTVCSCQK